jgi:hypothetical protein
VVTPSGAGPGKIFAALDAALTKSLRARETKLRPVPARLSSPP